MPKAVQPGIYEVRTVKAEQPGFEVWLDERRDAVTLLGGTEESDGGFWWAVEVHERLLWDAPTTEPVEIAEGQGEAEQGKGTGKGGPGLFGLLDASQLVNGILIAVAAGLLIKQLTKEDR